MSKVYLEFLTQIGDEKLKQVKKCKIQQYRVLQMQPQKHWVEGSLPTACHLCSDQCSTACGWPSPRGLTSDSSSMSCLWSPLLQICFLSSQCPGCTDAWYFPIPGARPSICLWWTSWGFCSWGFLQPVNVPLKDNCPPAYGLFLPPRCYLQTCRGCVPPYHLRHWCTC